MYEFLALLKGLNMNKNHRWFVDNDHFQSYIRFKAATSNPTHDSTLFNFEFEFFRNDR